MGILGTALAILSVIVATAILVLQRRAYRLAKENKAWAAEHAQWHRDEQKIQGAIAESVRDHVAMHRKMAAHREQAARRHLS